MYTSQDNSADGYLGSKNEMYRPTGVTHFNDATISVIAATGAVVGTNTAFQTGMPDPVTGAPTGASVEVGDILVINRINYPIVAAPTDE